MGKLQQDLINRVSGPKGLVAAVASCEAELGTDCEALELIGVAALKQKLSEHLANLEQLFQQAKTVTREHWANLDKKCTDLSEALCVVAKLKCDNVASVGLSDLSCQDLGLQMILSV